jgi:hypothetical protein
MVAANEQNNAGFAQAVEELNDGTTEINVFVARKNEILGNQGPGSRRRPRSRSSPRRASNRKMPPARRWSTPSPPRRPLGASGKLTQFFLRTRAS